MLPASWRDSMLSSSRQDRGTGIRVSSSTQAVSPG